MNTQYTTKPTGYAVRNCADIDCGECPLNHSEECLLSDLHTVRKRNGWIRVRTGEEVHHDHV